jgi:hypothetical protein
MSTVNERLTESVTKLGVQLEVFIVTLQKLDEIVNGTAKTGGLKERIAVAEEDIKRNKASFEKIGDHITELRNEMMIEIGKISAAANANAKAKGDFWRDLGQTVVKAGVVVIVTGVVGVGFWQLVIWLAAHAPLR